MNLVTYLSWFTNTEASKSLRMILQLLLALARPNLEQLNAQFNTHFKAVHQKYAEASAAAKEELWSEFAALRLPKRVLKVALELHGQAIVFSDPKSAPASQSD